MPAPLTSEQKRRAGMQIRMLMHEGIERDQAVAKAMDMAKRNSLDEHGNYRPVKGAHEED